MAKPIICGIPICLGVKPEWLDMPITNLPAGTQFVRRRFRHNSIGKAFVRTADGVQEWVLMLDGPRGLQLGQLRGANTRATIENQTCGCYQCHEERGDFSTLQRSMLVGMILCEKCGNKRCPHATNHRNDCTNSNELGQKGSRYPIGF